MEGFHATEAKSTGKGRSEYLARSPPGNELPEAGHKAEGFHTICPISDRSRSRLKKSGGFPYSITHRTNDDVDHLQSVAPCILAPITCAAGPADHTAPTQQMNY